MRMVKVMRAIGAVGLVLFPLLVLTACDTEARQGPVSVRSGADELELAICADMTIEEAFVSVYDQGKSSDIWVAIGEAEIRHGASFSVLAPPDGLATSEFNDVEINPRDDLYVTLNGPFTDGTASSASTAVKVPKSGLPRSEWLQTDGSFADDPCEYWK